MSYFGYCWLLLLFFIVIASENKITSFMHISFFFVSPQQLLNPLAHFNHILERKVDFLGIVIYSSLSENRRGENHSLCIRESVLYVSFRKVQTGNPALLLLLIVELLDFHGLPSLVLQVFTPISKLAKIERIDYKAYHGSVIFRFRIKLRTLLEVSQLKGFWGLGVVFVFFVVKMHPEFTCLWANFKGNAGPLFY